MRTSRTIFTIARDGRSPGRSRFFGRDAQELADLEERYETDRSGALTTNHYESGAFLCSGPTASVPDIELLMIPYFISPAAPEFRPPDRHGFTISGFSDTPAQRGGG
ncbi:hypothetical protein QW131_32135 [Roseibium salinum]|nr:hypothetical protein [Roseibium salinum]